MRLAAVPGLSVEVSELSAWRFESEPCSVALLLALHWNRGYRWGCGRDSPTRLAVCPLWERRPVVLGP